MELNEIIDFIDAEDIRLKKHYDWCTDKDKIVLAKIVKLNEEVGELCNEVLAATKFQRKIKLDAHSKDTLSDEFADVFITTLLLAKAMDVDIIYAIEKKISVIKTRNY